MEGRFRKLLEEYSALENSSAGYRIIILTWKLHDTTLLNAVPELLNADIISRLVFPGLLKIKHFINLKSNCSCGDRESRIFSSPSPQPFIPQSPQTMDGNNKDKTQSHFYIPRGKEDDLSNTLRKHFSHLRMKLQLQSIMIDDKNRTANDRS